MAATGSLTDHPDFPEFFRLAREGVWEEFAPRYERAVAADNVGAAERIQARIDELARQRAIVTLRTMVDAEAGRGPGARALARLGISGAAGERGTPPPTERAPTTVGIDYSRTPGREPPLSVLGRVPNVMTPEEIEANSGIIRRLLGMFGATRDAALAWERERQNAPRTSARETARAGIAGAAGEQRTPPGPNDEVFPGVTRAQMEEMLRNPSPEPATLGGPGRVDTSRLPTAEELRPDLALRNPLPDGPPPIAGAPPPPELSLGSTGFNETLNPAVRGALMPQSRGEQEEYDRSNREAAAIVDAAGIAAPFAIPGGPIIRGAQAVARGAGALARGAGNLLAQVPRTTAAATVGGVTTLGTGETQTPGLTPSQILEGLRKDREDAVAARNRALAEREEEARGGRGRAAGRGPNWNRLTAEVERHGTTIDQLDGQIRRVTYELSPQGQADAARVAEAERVLNRSLADIRRPFHEAAPNWLQNVQPILPAILGFGTAIAMRAHGAIGSRISSRAWGRATEAGLRPGATPAEIALNAALARNSAAHYPGPQSYRGAYGLPMALGGVEGLIATNLPEGYNAFLPALNQARIVWQEYLDRLPAHEVYNAERERVRTLLEKLPVPNVWRDAARDYFGSRAFGTRTAVGIAEAAGAAGLGVTLGRVPAPSTARVGTLRAETEALNERTAGLGRDGRLPWSPPQTRELRLEEVPNGRGTGYRDAVTGHFATREDLDLWFATRRHGRR